MDFPDLLKTKGAWIDSTSQNILISNTYDYETYRQALNKNFGEIQFCSDVISLNDQYYLLVLWYGVIQIRDQFYAKDFSKQ